MSDEAKPDLVPYPIQLGSLAVRELFVKTYRQLPPDFEVDIERVRVQSSAFAYDPADHHVQIELSIYVGSEEEPDEERANEMVEARELDLRLRVTLMGNFYVDETKFPMDRLEEWSQVNAGHILFPYVREQVYALTIRCGIRPLLLPLVYLPTMKVVSPEVVSVPSEPVEANSH